LVWLKCYIRTLICCKIWWSQTMWHIISRSHCVVKI